MLDIIQILDSVSYKSRAEGYLNLCLQTRLLQQSGTNQNYLYDVFLPTIRGRRFYASAMSDQGAAMRFGKLVLTHEFSHKLQDEYAFLVSQTKFIRKRLRLWILANLMNNS